MAPSPIPSPQPIVLTPEERATLERWARGRRVPRRLVRRARIILQAAAGLSNAAIARVCRTDRECVGRWRARFLAQRLAGLQHEAPRPGRPPVLPEDVLQAIGNLLVTTTRPGGRPWSPRSFAREAGVSPATIRRCCRANGLAPHRVRTLFLRAAPFPGFTRLTQILGGYLTDWESALVLGGDAVGPHRPTPPAPLPRPNLRGVPARYAVNVASVARWVAGPPGANRLIDWLQFLAHVAARVPRDRWVHVLADNAELHVHPAVWAWLAAHPRVVLHLVPADQPLPRWFQVALQQLVDQEHRPAPLPSPLRALPQWARQSLRERGLVPQPRVVSLRDAVTRLCRRSARRRTPSYWMDSKATVRVLTGNPRSHLLPDE